MFCATWVIETENYDRSIRNIHGDRASLYQMTEYLPFSQTSSGRRGALFASFDA